MVSEQELQDKINNNKKIWYESWGKIKSLKLDSTWVIARSIPMEFSLSSFNILDMELILTQKRNEGFIYLSIPLKRIFSTRKEALEYVKEIKNG